MDAIRLAIRQQTQTLETGLLLYDRYDESTIDAECRIDLARSKLNSCDTFKHGFTFETLGVRLSEEVTASPAAAQNPKGLTIS